MKQKLRWLAGHPTAWILRVLGDLLWTPLMVWRWRVYPAYRHILVACYHVDKWAGKPSVLQVKQGES